MFGITWEATITCRGCGKQCKQGPVQIGVRDEPSIGHPPEGWLRIEIHSSEKVLPRQMDGIAQTLREQPIPPELAEAQLEAMRMGCPDFHVAFDYCDECIANPETFGQLGPAIAAEQKRLLELVEAEFQAPDNLVIGPFGGPETLDA
jgi:hypothetical protein